MDNQVVLILVIIVAIAVLAFVLIFMRLVGLWLSAILAGVRVSLLQMVLMRWRRVDPRAIVDNMDLTVGNIMFDNAFLIVYDAKYLPQLTALAVMAARELARDKDGGLSNRS